MNYFLLRQKLFMTDQYIWMKEDEEEEEEEEEQQQQQQQQRRRRRWQDCT